MRAHNDQVIYNAEGDLLFSVSKDHLINAWCKLAALALPMLSECASFHPSKLSERPPLFRVCAVSHNGERLGTYHGHNGTVWTISVDSTSTFLVSGSADNQIRLWKVSTGECLKVWEMKTAIKRIAFSEDDTRILACTEARMGHIGTITVFDVSSEGDGKTQADEPSLIINCPASKANMAGWTALDKYIVSAHEDGSICQWDPKDGELVNKTSGVHEATVMDLQMSQDRSYFITASRDKTAKVSFRSCRSWS